MPRTPEMSSRRINSLWICLLLALPLLFLVPRGSHGAISHSGKIIAPLDCEPTPTRNFHHIKDNIPDVVLCENDYITWKHTGTNKPDFKIVFDPPTHTPFSGPITYNLDGSAVSPPANKPNPDPDHYDYHVQSNTGTTVGPKVHVIVLGVRR